MSTVEVSAPSGRPVASHTRALATEPFAVEGAAAQVRATKAPQTRSGRWWELHPRSIRVVAAAALLAGGVYLGYRLLESGRGVAPVPFALLCAVELYNFVSLAFLAFYGWTVAEPTRPPATPGYRVDVFVTTYDEPAEILEATLAGCAAMRYPHVTYLLDDGRRPELAELARTWGARWITRPDNAHAKAGNINHALASTSGDLVFCLDADHVPLPDALDATVGYFDDERVGLVQSPHDFYNQDSVQHYGVGRHEQSLFFEVVCPGKDRHNGVFWCGSAALIRRSALQSVGGVSTETIAEDFHTTAKMHRLGWVSRYHDEVLVQGLAPLDLDGYLLQRDRWARGNLAVLRLPESPLSRRAGLALRQRISYAGNLFAYGAGAARLALIALLVSTLAGGVLPARMSVAALLVLWVPWTALAVTASAALSRGHLRLSEASHYTLLTSEIFTRALRCAFVPSRTTFKVTPKAGADTAGWRALGRLRVVLVLGAALALSVVWRALGTASVLPARPLPLWAALVAMVLGAWELVRISRSARTVARRTQRREHVRFDCLVPASVLGEGDGAARAVARVTDVAVSGIGLVAPHAVGPGEVLRVEFSLEDHDGRGLPVSATVRVRSSRPEPGGGWRLGTSIVESDPESHEHIVRYCHVAYPYARLRVPAPAVRAPLRAATAASAAGHRTLARAFGRSRQPVPGAGLEPARPRGQRLLRPPRLPFRHPGRYVACRARRPAERDYRRSTRPG